jgi:YHS domain-containing protein
MSKFYICFSMPEERVIEAKSRAEAIEELKSRFLTTKIHYVEELNPICKQCNKEFTPKKTDNRGKKREFCSTKCKSRFHYLNIIKPKKESRKNDTARFIL